MGVLVGGETGFARFVRDNATALSQTAYLITGNRAEAEELVQDTLVRLYPKWDKVAGAEYPLAYVRRTLANTYINHCRRASRREVAYADVPDVLDERDSISTVADRDEIWDALQTLPYRQRAALVLRFFDDLTDEQSARALGCRVGTVRSLVSRGLAALRAQLNASSL